MSLQSRVLRIEEKVSIKNQPNWLFITVISPDGEKIMQVTDVNNIYEGTCKNEEELPNNEFLPIAEEFFGVDMAKEWSNTHEYIEWGK